MNCYNVTNTRVLYNLTKLNIYSCYQSTFLVNGMREQIKICGWQYTFWCKRSFTTTLYMHKRKKII